MSDELIEPYSDMFWIKRPVLDSRGAEHGEQFLRNLQDCAKLAKHRPRASQSDTKVVRARRSIEEYVVQAISSGFWEQPRRI